jgi:acetyl esterase
MQSIKVIGIRSATCAMALTALAGCQTGSAFRDPLARMNPDMQAVVVAYEASGAKPVHTLTVDQARSQPTLADAVRTVERSQTGHPLLQTAFVRTTDMTVPGAAGPLPARLYNATPGHPNQPIVLYFHGGGGVIGDLDSADQAARALTTQGHFMVLSVAYRLAPEARFPAAQDDGFAAYQWLLQNAASLGADRRRVAVAGDAWGATIAADISLAARDNHVKLPVHELLIEPVVSPDTQTRSEIANQNTVPLSRADEEWFFHNLATSPSDAVDPRVDLLGRADLHGLPPTTIISSEMDPLESDATTVTLKMQVQGVDVTRIEYQGTAHGFFGMGAVVARSKEAEDFAANALNVTFNQIGEPPQSRAGYRPGRKGGARYNARRPHGS